tara:strand:- start:88 stop:528 length:441 start_codon:yes stop_codon:yes gene_type:complete
MNSQILLAKNRFIKRINKDRFVKRINKNNTNFNDLVKIKKVHIRGYWRWNIHNNICAICRNYIFEPSINSSCQECNTVVGQCGHAYHYDCILSWLSTSIFEKCPLCNCKWTFKKSNKIVKNTNDNIINEPIVYTDTSNIEESMSND